MGLDMYITTNSKKMCKAINKVDESSTDYEQHWTKYRRRAGVVCQWRKANQIHKWFVDNVQGGNDDCGYYNVSPAQLRELLDIVDTVLDSTRLVDGNVVNGYTYYEGVNRVANIESGKVLEDTSVAREFLPTEEGFFFGSQEYDQWYWQDLLSTKEQLESVLALIVEEKGDYGFHYYHTKGEKDWDLTLQYHSSW